MLLAHGYSTYMVGKWHLIAERDQETAAGPYDRWPLGRGFERFYGFLGGDTSQWYPDLVYDNHQVEPPEAAEEGYHLTEDLVDKAIQFITDAKQVDPGQAVLPALLLGRDARPAPRAQGVGRPVRRAVRRRLGRLPREGLRPPEGARDRSRPTPSCRATTPTCPSGSRCRRRPAPAVRADDGGVRRLPEPHRSPHRPAARLPATRSASSTTRSIMVISDNGASAEGGPTGTTNEAQFFNNAQEPFEDSLAAIDEIGGPKHFNHYPWGWTWAGNTPFRRWKRETYRGGSSDPFIVTGRTGSRPRARCATQYAHIIDMVPTVLDAARASSRPRRSAACPSRRCTGVELRATPSTTRGGEPAPHAVLRDAGPPLDLPRRLAGGVPVAGAVVRRGRQGVRRADLRGEARRARRPRLGALPRRRGPRREPQPRRRAPRPADRA